MKTPRHVSISNLIHNIIPKRLGIWLLENYDYCGSFLNLPNRKILEFTKEDVHAILALTMGPKKAVEGKSYDSCEKYNASCSDRAIILTKSTSLGYNSTSCWHVDSILEVGK